MESLVRCMTALLAAVTGQKIKADGACLRALGPDAMAACFLGILGHKPLELGLGSFMLDVSRSRLGKDAGELRPGIGGSHIDHPHRRDPRFWRLNAKRLWLLAALDTAPELPLGRDNEVLIERIGMGEDLDPLASSRNYREHRGPCRHHP